MLGRRVRCRALRDDGQPCQSTPRGESRYCLWHDPERQDEAAEARKLGGHRRRRERIVAGAYDFEGLGSIEAILRVVEVAILDTLGLEIGVNWNKALGSLAIVPRPEI
jgi:hypothetical protein